MATEYFTPEGLAQLSLFESSGNPTAQSSLSSASGLYGFLTGTWQDYAPQAGVDLSQYPTAASAPASVQTAVASITPSSNWTCTNCDANISAAVQSDPSLLSETPSAQQPGITVSSPDSNYLLGGGDFQNLGTPLDSNSYNGSLTGAIDNGAVSGPQDYSGGTDPLTGVFSEGYSTNGLGTPTATASNDAPSFWSTLETDFVNFLTRGGLILLGIVVLAIGGFAVARGEQPHQTVRSSAKLLAGAFS